MSGLSRRLMLKALGVTPVAAPLAAKEATQKMLAPMDLGGGPVPEVGYAQGGSTESLEEIRRDVMSWWGDHTNSKRRKAKRREPVTHFDPDLASMVSMSPSVARSIQAERNLIAWERENRTNMLGYYRGRADRINARVPFDLLMKTMGISDDD